MRAGPTTTPLAACNSNVEPCVATPRSYWRFAIHVVWPEAIAWLLGAAFLFAGAAKLASPNEAKAFMEVIVGGPVYSWVIPSVAIIEVVVAIAIVAGARRKVFMVGAICFLLLASGILVFANHRGYTGSCGCFGRLMSQSAGAAVIRNGILVLVTTSAIFVGKQ